LSIEQDTLTIFPGALGDLICFLPALDFLRAGCEGRQQVLCAGSLAEIFKRSPILARPLESEVSAWLFSSHPPEAADRFFGAFGEVLCFTGHNVPEVRENLNRWNGRLFPFRPEHPTHLATHFLGCVGGDLTTPPIARLSELAEFRAEGATWRLQAGLNTKPLLVVHPGSGGDSKRWSELGFIEVAKRWCERGGVVSFLLGPAERSELGRWSGLGGEVVVDSTLSRSAAILAATDAYLGNDSGVSHLAAAVGARGLALFGPTDPDLWRPLSPSLRALRLEPWESRHEGASPTMISVVYQELTDAVGSVFP
jgi:ADP-heptose:LPS heptosyltransferase